MTNMGGDDDNEQQKLHNQQAAQLAAIEQEVKKQVLTSSLLPIQYLVDYYETHLPDATPGFLQGANYLGSNYTHFRRVRGDGNCYYRALLYSICEVCLKGQAPKEQFSALKDFISTSLKHVCQFGYDENALDMFHEELVDLFDFISASTSIDSNGVDVDEKLKEMHARLNEENGSSDYCTWFLRVITAAHLKSDADRFMLFLDASDDTVDHYLDIATFCSREVEPMGKECGMVQVTALAEAMNVRVNVEYLDGRDLAEGSKKLMRYEFGPDGGLEVTLLYRPGHYDILYKF